jgi:hypothetical protein
LPEMLFAHVDGSGVVKNCTPEPISGSSEN